jgi:hypothetical protein
MDGLKEAIELLVSIGEKDFTKVIHGRTYGYPGLKVIPEPEVKPLRIGTLSGVVDFINSGIDDSLPGRLNKPWLIIIESPTLLSLTTPADNTSREREEYIKCEASLPYISLNSFTDAESFNIMLQSTFVDVGDRAHILKLIGNLREENVQNTSDDGVTQKVTAKVGVEINSKVAVPNPVSLAPYRTFTEIDQPESLFVLRIHNGPRCGLYEADGGKWKQAAMDNIKSYFQEKLLTQINDKKVFVIS